MRVKRCVSTSEACQAMRTKGCVRVHRHVHGHVHRHAHRHVHRHAHRHVHGHVHGHVHRHAQRHVHWHVHGHGVAARTALDGDQTAGVFLHGGVHSAEPPHA